MIDAQLLFSDKQTFAAADSTNTIDQKYDFNNAGGFIQIIGHGIAGATAITVTVKESDDGSTWVNRETQTFSDMAAVNAGQCAIAMGKPLKRFCKLTYAATGSITGGTVTAFLTNKIISPSVYPTKRT